ncbi:glycoside hydrolase family 5 protein [Longispora albida]|uniref:glycoside hydrolase family 5 protein n=1 Tax=Longispora albida TaxID=203523 RepID=UPI00068543E5|nr:cellulase family glycosylhydrolase [Longispora albida]
MRRITRITRPVAALALLAALLTPVTTTARASEPEPGLAGSWTGPLSTRGRYVVDATGNRFKLKSGNWEGAQGTWTGSGDIGDPANHAHGIPSYNMPLGLDRVPMSRILADFHGLGINSVRLPFSNAMLHDTTPVPDFAVAANPGLRGKTPLQVFDVVVGALTAEGFAVILNNHTTTARWCCGLDGNERWNSGQSTEQWIADWVFLAQRYAANKRVAGADLRNEVRRDTWDDPNWGWGNQHDLNLAHQQAGLAIQRAVPDLLIIMEGINWYGIPAAIFPHGRPQLKPAGSLSNTLPRTDKLVYSAHFYGFTGPANTGADSGLGATSDPRYRDFSAAELARVVREEALFVTTAGQHHTAPVWVSEFGTGGIGSADAKERAWWSTFADILIANDTDFAVWPLVGWARDGSPVDNWALLSYDTNGTAVTIDDPRDWRSAAWRRLTGAPSATGPVAKPSRWNMLNLDYADYNASARTTDWDSGARKGTCPDSQRLMGLGRSDSRGLCTDHRQPELTGVSTVVTDERFVTSDWASGYNKLQCPAGHIAVGYSVRSNAMSALLCAQTRTAQPLTGRNVWFDHGDNRPAGGGSTASDWAPGYYKGQCADNEYIAGVAYTWRWNHGGVPDTLLCRPLA